MSLILFVCQYISVFKFGVDGSGISKVILFSCPPRGVLDEFQSMSGRCFVLVLVKGLLECLLHVKVERRRVRLEVVLFSGQRSFINLRVMLFVYQYISALVYYQKV